MQTLLSRCCKEVAIPNVALSVGCFEDFVVPIAPAVGCFEEAVVPDVVVDVGAAVAVADCVRTKNSYI